MDRLSNINCETCKYWKAPATGEYATTPVEDKRFGVCQKVLSGLEYTYQPSADAWWPKEPLVNQIAVIDYEMASLCTRPEFGCSLWESGYVEDYQI